MNRLLTSFAIAAIALPATAQDGAATPDWDVQRDARAKSVFAYSAFDNGLTIGVRCVNRSFEAFVAGLPEARGETRPLRLRFTDDRREAAQAWNVAIDPGVAVSSFPARFARDLREGGRLDIVVPGAAEGGRNLRYVLDLPVSPAAIDETLTACGKPLIDPRDADIPEFGPNGLPGSVRWVRPPRAFYPANHYAKGFAVLTCLTNADGTLRDCVVESEHPHDGGFGSAALRGAARARLQNTLDPSAQMAGGFVSFRTNFYMEGYEPGARRSAPTGSRISSSESE